MSSLSITPDIVSAASENLQNVGSELRRAGAAAASQTTAVAAPAADEVSAAITSLFGAHAQEFQSASARAAAFHDEFVNLLTGGAAQYVGTEAANVQQTLANVVNAPAQSSLGGAAATPADSSYSTFGGTYDLGPVQVTLGGTAFSSHGTGTHAFYGGGVTVNTPFGVLGGQLFHGEAFDTGQGPFAANLYVNSPLGPTGGQIAGTTIDGLFQIPTSTSLTIFGLRLY
jgi:PE family